MNRQELGAWAAAVLPGGRRHELWEQALDLERLTSRGARRLESSLNSDDRFSLLKAFHIFNPPRGLQGSALSLVERRRLERFLSCAGAGWAAQAALDFWSLPLPERRSGGYFGMAVDYRPAERAVEKVTLYCKPRRAAHLRALSRRLGLPIIDRIERGRLLAVGLDIRTSSRALGLKLYYRRLAPPARLRALWAQLRRCSMGALVAKTQVGPRGSEGGGVYMATSIEHADVFMTFPALRRLRPLSPFNDFLDAVGPALSGLAIAHIGVKRAGRQLELYFQSQRGFRS